MNFSNYNPTQSRINCERFKSNTVAEKYPSKFRSNHFRDYLEVKAIQKALKHIHIGAHVLDFPCGTGRLLNLLLDAELDVTAADLSEEMLRIATHNFQTYTRSQLENDRTVSFLKEDILNTKFRDREFDSVICHRLFHHLVERETRIRAINEIRRISKGPVIISFLNSSAISSHWKNFKNFVRNHKQEDRLRFDINVFKKEIESCSMELVEVVPVLKHVLSLQLIVAQKVV